MVSQVARVRIRMYQVGFGDCFLMSLEYDQPLPDGRAERHMLIDYGSTRSAREHRAKGRMSEVAKLIADHTHGQLDVVVLTHRHKDHLFGFSDNTGAETIRDLKPKLVLRPWTEDPDLPAIADGPAVAPADPAAAIGADSARFSRSLSEAQDAVGLLAARPGLHAGLKAAAEDQLKNADAIAFLDELSADGRGRYLFAGSDPDTSEVLPGLAITVLGPPTIEQDPRAAKQRDEDPQYWMLALRTSLREAAAATSRGSGAQPTVRVGPGPVRWLILRLAQQKIRSVARLVRKLDDALNNTSLILLIEVGNLSMLFPGDAQIENWQFTLDRVPLEPELRQKLAAVDLYKVGHHGSRNATPRSLHALWVDRPDTLPRLTALMSTRPDVHGESEATAVPRATLVTALEQVASLISTDDLDQGEPFVELVAETTGGPFARVP
jgi:ribonuclease BN (tRNA processing enzyme)